MDRVQFFDWTMHVIDSWKLEKDEVKDNTGPWKWLNQGETRKILSTPSYRGTICKLKNFLLFHIMDIYHPDSNSRVGWKDVEDLLKKENYKKYSFRIKNLDKYKDIEENRTAFLQRGQWKKLEAVRTTIEDIMQLLDVKNEWIPYLLLEDIQRVARKKIGKYYKTYIEYKKREESGELNKYNNDNEESRKKLKAIYDEWCKNLEKIHEECAFAIALHEIFLMELYDDSMAEELKKGIELSLSKELEQLKEIEKCLELDKEKMDEICNKLEEFCKQMDEIKKKTKSAWLIPILNYEFQTSLAAEQQVLMLFEALNLAKRETSDSFKISEEIIKKAKAKYLLDMELLQEVYSVKNLNSNRWIAYNEVSDYINEAFAQVKEIKFVVKKSKGKKFKRVSISSGTVKSKKKINWEKIHKEKITVTRVEIDKWFRHIKRFLTEVAKAEKNWSLDKLWESQLVMAMWIF